MDKLMKRTFNAQVSEKVLKTIHDRKLKECVRILDLRVQVHPGELWVSKQRVQKVMSQRSAGSCTRCNPANAFPDKGPILNKDFMQTIAFNHISSYCVVSTTP